MTPIQLPSREAMQAADWLLEGLDNGYLDGGPGFGSGGFGRGRYGWPDGTGQLTNNAVRPTAAP